MQGLLDIQNVEYVLEKLKTYNNLFVLVLQNIKGVKSRKMYSNYLMQGTPSLKKVLFPKHSMFSKTLQVTFVFSTSSHLYPPN